eukprot:CAMPEP_0118861490 /NCGR_PEP_ID=MMETSP1163-20130328/7005_1 /TAXON_ID=124430 /ORGANISM="Phaeomonas parva, Strain CCMP2877" /LENGTH=112 /DNA_ID=CAMNT_0006795307 /DNA_START=49 /DNA_END=387 /DNA_ORIENTATION=+
MGFEKELVAEGDGAEVVAGQTVTVHCTGFVVEGEDSFRKFWSTRDDDSPFSFQIGMGSVIKAWDEGVLTMKIGERAKITCTPDYGYGAGGFPAWGIPPNGTLMFDIEVMSAA